MAEGVGGVTLRPDPPPIADCTMLESYPPSWNSIVDLKEMLSWISEVSEAFLCLDQCDEKTIAEREDTQAEGRELPSLVNVTKREKAIDLIEMETAGVSH
jgi:hypothetical protein